MEKKNKIKRNPTDIEKYILEYATDRTISNKDVYSAFPEVKKGTIRQCLKRLDDRGGIIRVQEGIYYKPDPNRRLKNNYLSTEEIVENEYLMNNGKRIGYKSGLSFANKLNLTTQVANFETIISNSVSKKKREILINNSGIIADAPRVKVSEQNYKLLQVLDLMNAFENVSEYNLEYAAPLVSQYLDDVKLSKDQILQCVNAYPLKAQVNFYKSGVYHEIIK